MLRMIVNSLIQSCIVHWSVWSTLSGLYLFTEYRDRTDAVLNYVYSQLKCSNIKNVYISNEKTKYWNKLCDFI